MDMSRTVRVIVLVTTQPNQMNDGTFLRHTMAMVIQFSEGTLFPRGHIGSIDYNKSKYYIMMILSNNREL